MRADRKLAGHLPDRHLRSDLLRWVMSTVLALAVVVALLMIGMAF